MSRAMIFLVSIAACSSPPSPKPPTTTTTAAVEKEPSPAPEPVAAPPPEPVAPNVPPPVHDRLRDGDGPIAGLPGFSLKRTPSTSHCGGTKITTTRGKTVAPDDKQLAAVLALEFPTGLSFDPDPTKKAVKEASLKKFDNFIKTLTKTSAEAVTFYADKIQATDAATKMAAIARTVQVEFHVASVIARAEIPKDVRTGEFKDEKIAAYCDKMTEVSEPLVDRAEDALKNCSTLAKQAAATGWWNEVCGSK